MPQPAPAKEEIEISYAADAEKIANQLIDQYHSHLLQAKILYLFSSQKRKSCGQIVRGSAAKMDPVKKFLASGSAADVQEGHDFLILLSSREWAELSPEMRVRLVDHELSHLAVSDESKWKLVGHDVEEFVHIIARHGLLEQRDRDMARASVTQLRLMTDDTVDRSPISAEARTELADLLGGMSLDPDEPVP